MHQELISKICAALYQNPTVLKDWPLFLKTIAWVESSIYLEQKSSFHTCKPMHNREKLIDKAIENCHSFNNYNNQRTTIAFGNLQVFPQVAKVAEVKKAVVITAIIKNEDFLIIH